MSALNAVLAAGRVAAAELMRETVTLFRRPGEPAFDRGTGQTVQGPPEVVFYEGPARVRALQAEEEQVQAGEREVALVQHRISLPFGTELPAGHRPQPGDVVDVVTSPDPRMAGVRLWVTSVTHSSTATVWRITGEGRQS